MKKSLLTRGLAIGIACSMAFLCACGKKKDNNTGTDTVVPAAQIDRDHVFSMEDVVLPVDNYSVNGCSTNKDSIFFMAGINSDENYEKKLFRMDFADQKITEIALESTAWYECFDCDNAGNIYLVKSGYDPETYDEDDYEMSTESGEIEQKLDEDESEETVEDIDQYVGEMETESGEIEQKLDSGITKTISVDADSEDMDLELTEEDGQSDEAPEEKNDSKSGDDTASDKTGDDKDVKAEAGEEAEVTGGESEESTIVKLSPTGELIWEKPLTEEDAKGYVQSIRYVDGKGIITNCNGEFSLYDENTGEGKSICTRHEADAEDYYYATLYKMMNGDLYLCEDSWGSDGKVALVKFNKEKLDFDEELSLPEGIYGGDSLQPGRAYDFYVNDNSEIRAFNIGDEKAELICDFTASDILVDYLNYVTDTPDGKLFIAINADDGTTSLAYLSKVDPKDVTEKETLTIGTIFIPNSIRQQVVKFNRTNDKYRIKIVDYSETDAGDNSDAYMDAANQIGLDLTQGKAPDMLVIDYNMPADSYAEKGALEPLDPYFEADSEISASDFLENVMEATKVGDKMYSIIPSFNVQTCIAAKNKVNGTKVTLKNYKDICESNGIDPKLGMGTMTQDSAGQLYSTVGTQFVDFKNGSCSFDSQGFIDLLKFINDLPKDEDTEMDYEDSEAYYRENKALLMTYFISSFEDYQVLKKGYFGTEIEFNGFPSDDDAQSYISPYLQIAMNSDCKHKDVAWEFMKSFMTDEYQNKIEWSFPVKKTAMDALAAKAQEKPYYIDSKGKKVETSSTWSIGGIDVEIEELSKEETDELVNFVKSVNKTTLYEEKIVNIITEEADAYFEGQKTAEEVADIIQSRVSLYMSENM